LAIVWRRRVIFTRSSRGASASEDAARATLTGSAAAAAGGRRRDALGDSGDHVTLQHLATLAGAVDLVGRDVVFSQQLRSRRGRRHGGGSGSRLCFCGGRRGSSLLDLFDLFGNGRSSRTGGRAFGDLAEQAARLDRLAGIRDDFRQDAGSGCGHFDRHLVGFELTERFIGLDDVSPTFLNQVPTVASLTDSPKVGTRISVAMSLVPLFRCLFVAGEAGEISLSQRVFEERSELREMLGHQARRRRCGGRTARVADASGTWRQYAPAPIRGKDR
jgi:hypothetical protein